MRKHVLAFLSIFGLAGSSTPASAQVVKGSQSANTKSESTVKTSKTAQESAAGQGAATLTVRKAGGEQNASKQDSSKKVLIGLSQPSKNDVDAKMRKAGGEQQAAASAQGKKEAKTNAGFADGSVRTSHTGGGGGAGKVAMQDLHIKRAKNTAEVNGGLQDASKKAEKQAVQPSAQKQIDKASPK
jgi:prepilin-type processing-associated H-X9-DG protein